MHLIKFLLSLLVARCEGIQLREDRKIQGGYEVSDIRTFPCVGRFTVPPPLNVICSGVIIDQFSAISAGHCVLVNASEKPFRLLPLNKYKPYLVMGAAEPSNVFDRFRQPRDIQKLFIHPKAKFDLGYPFNDFYDIGAMKWTKRVILNAQIQTIPLIPEAKDPPKVFDDIIRKGGHCEMAGWGELKVHWKDPNQWARRADKLRAAEFDIKSIEDCCMVFFASKYDECMTTLGLVSGMYCHVRHVENTSMALGDSGSPVYCPYKGKRYVVGINIAGLYNLDPPNRGSVEILTPSYFIIDAVMRTYIKDIIRAPIPSGFTNRGEKGTIGLFDSLLLHLPIFNWFIWQH